MPSDLLARLERLQLATRRPLVGGLSGEHRSRRHGSSLDFADFREYEAGDDLRRLDTRSLAAHDRLLIRLFDAEDDLTVRLLVDTSGSMSGAKQQRAAQVAAAIGFTALVRRDSVALHTFPATGPTRRFRGRSATRPLIDALADLRPQGATPFAEATLDLLARPGPAGLTVVCSDLLTSQWDQGIRRLPARRDDLVVVHVLDRTDLEPDLSGDLELVDAETGELVEVSLTRATVDAYRAAAVAWADDVAARVRAVGGAYLRVLTDTPLATVLGVDAPASGILR